MFRDIFTNRLFIGALAFFVLCVAGSLLYMHHENKKGAEYAAETENRVRQWNAKQKEQPAAEAPVVEQPEQVGHFHADGTWHGEPHAPIEVPAEVDPSEATGAVDPSEPAMALTYHAELLKSDPVEALRQQGKERGHWSADYLPDFPLDDTEAMEIARAIYDYIYFGHTIPVSKHHDSSEFQRAAEKMDRLLFNEVNERYPITSSDWDVRARHTDLKILAWPCLPYASERIQRYRDYTYPSLLIRTTRYPDLPELGERK